MTNEIKEILVCMSKVSFHKQGIALETEQVKLLLDYITNLQEKLKVSQTNEETYRLEMQDITKCLGLKEDTIFDEVKEYATNLQEENKNRISESLAYDLANARIKELQEERETLYKYTPEKGFRLVGDDDVKD